LTIYLNEPLQYSIRQHPSILFNILDELLINHDIPRTQSYSRSAQLYQTINFLAHNQILHLWHEVNHHRLA
jgi:hypothetical protein